MMDDITDNDTVMAWKYGLNMQMVGVTDGFTHGAI